MTDGPLFVAKLTGRSPRPIAFNQVILSSNGIMPYHPKPDFDFERDLAFPKVFKRSVSPITAQMFVH
jgi:hypothetical protein